ncbi:MAG: cardiolipin synthase [Lachnospiraceae bacterium]|nr:cardiolipin synthase [Lachnospiraceae bacterium]
MRIRKIIFSRVTLMLLMVITEGLLIALFVHWLGRNAGWISGGLRIISIFILLNIVRTSRHLSADIMWIFVIFLFPVFGTAVYIILGTNIITSRQTWRLVGTTADSRKYYQQDPKVLTEASDQFPACKGQLRYLSDYAGFPVYENHEEGFQYYPLGDDGFPVMLEEMKKAQKYIFLEYFIIDPGEMWDQMHQVLKEKASQGVLVRVLYDDMGSFTTLPMHYANTLEEEGIHCIPFNRISPVLGAIMNHRDHRKILVIDGKTAFSGGINLADEYINAIERFGHWKDNVIRIKGPTVWSYTVMFLTHWKALSKEDEDFTKYKVEGGYPTEEKDGYIIPYADSPLDRDHVGQDVYMNILNEAERYCYIMTPYLILDNEFVNALILASARGVDVRIITPGIPDKKTVWGVTRSFYEELIRGGVKIFEYTPGFVHAKVFVSDDRVATVGTINLDYRSLYLHFENGTCLVGSKEVLKVRDDVGETIRQCHEFTLKEAKFGPIANIKNSVIRIFAGQL